MSMNDSSDLNAILTSRIARLWKSDGMSVDELAGRALLEVGQVERILTGIEAVSFDQLVLLAGALGIEAQALMGGIEWVPDGRGGGRYRVSRAED
jgi:transcriptional regulator with XRE-family HTH domain